MPLLVKSFSQLTTKELFDIYKLRTAVFVVEQHCPYQEVDDYDLRAVHVFYRENGRLAAYARVLPPGTEFSGVVAIGRVIAVKRRAGWGTRIVSAAMDVARERFGAQRIALEAQVYAAPLYEKLGFVKTGAPFDLDGIPHVKMAWNEEVPCGN